MWEHSHRFCLIGAIVAYDLAMTRYAQAERRTLAGLLTELGPDAPTLCAGWTTRDLAAHLVVRERRPDAAAGLVVPPLHGYGERVRERTAADEYAELVRQVGRPPWWSPVSNPLVDDAVNAMEFFIHHEDVRRAQPEWRPRELPHEQQAALWSRAGWLAKRLPRKLSATARLTAPGFGRVTVGRYGPLVKLTGAPGELVLFLSGRQRVARVQLDGPPDLVSALRGGSLPI